MKKGLRHKCFPVNFWKFLITVSFIEHLWAPGSVNLYPLEIRSMFLLFPSKVDRKDTDIDHTDN